MIERRGLNQYFEKSGDGVSYRLKAVVLNEQQIPEAILQPHKWTPNQARRFVRYCQNSNVPTAAERLEQNLQEYFIQLKNQ